MTRRLASLLHRYGLSLVMLAIAAPSMMGQVDAQLSQYYEVPAYYNPGAVGLTDLLRIRAGSRLQWVGIDNAPKTFLGVADMPIAISRFKIGVGVVVEQESMGLYDNLTAGLQLGWKLKLLGGELTPALRIGILNEGFKGSKVYLPGDSDDETSSSTDEAIPTTDVSGTALDLGLGVFFTHKKGWWAGISCTHLNGPSIKFQSESGGTVSGGTDENGEAKYYTFKADPTLYFMAGGNIPWKNTLFEVMPSLMAKTTFTFTRVELNCRLRYNKFLTAGVGYRFDDAVIVTLGAEYRGFFLGYSYDYPTTDIAKASSGSHEIYAGYSMKINFGEKNNHKHKSIRIM
ncbi:MAG: PorP/SprF family type IX secretion system membrane protein [Bacteroidales bacterium]|nr:PorP/SprF family type IX secretion system membrane protein [Bacteroidales bacterium]